MSKWIKILYTDAWYPNGNICVLTTAEPDRGWEGQKYAIFGFNENHLHVAFWPCGFKVIKQKEIEKDKAEKLIWKTLNGRSLMDNFNKVYK